MQGMMQNWPREQHPFDSCGFHAVHTVHAVRAVPHAEIAHSCGTPLSFQMRLHILMAPALEYMLCMLCCSQSVFFLATLDLRYIAKHDDVYVLHVLHLPWSVCCACFGVGGV